MSKWGKLKRSANEFRFFPASLFSRLFRADACTWSRDLTILKDHEVDCKWRLMECPECSCTHIRAEEQVHDCGSADVQS